MKLRATGNDAASSMVSGISSDKAPPAITARRDTPANSNGWNKANVPVVFSGSGGLSGIDSCTADTTLSGEGSNQSVSGTCTDLAGNVSSTATLDGINIDKTPPILQSVSPVAGARRKITAIVLNFSEDLQISGAQNLANYTLTLSRGRRTTTVPLRSSTYAAKTVTLIPTKPLAAKKLASYSLTVQNLTDLADNVLVTTTVSLVTAAPRSATAAVVHSIDALLEERRLSGYLHLEPAS